MAQLRRTMHARPVHYIVVCSVFEKLSRFYDLIWQPGHPCETLGDNTSKCTCIQFTKSAKNQEALLAKVNYHNLWET